MTAIPDSIARAAAQRLEETGRDRPHPFGIPPRPRTQEPPVESTEGEEAESQDELTGWEFIDLRETLAGLRAGTIVRPTPTVGVLSDGSALFYERRINGLFGASGEGKSMVAHAMAVQEISAGRDVIWADFEDDEVGTLTRLIDLGADDDSINRHFHYDRPNLPTSYRVYDQLEAKLDGLDCRFAVVDSLGEFMALEGVKDEDGPVARLMAGLPKFLANLGPAVLPLDHVTKTKENGPKGFAIGSQRKRAAVSGAAYEVIQYKPMAAGVVGAVKLVVAKDRNGHRKKGTTAVEITVDSTADDGRILVSFDPPEVSTNAAGEFRPTVLMERASEWLEQNPGGQSQRAVVNGVKGNRDALIRALYCLVEEGYAKNVGDSSAHRYESVRRFTDA